MKYKEWFKISINKADLGEDWDYDDILMGILNNAEAKACIEMFTENLRCRLYLVYGYKGIKSNKKYEL